MGISLAMEKSRDVICNTGGMFRQIFGTRLCTTIAVYDNSPKSQSLPSGKLLHSY